VVLWRSIYSGKQQIYTFSKTKLLAQEVIIILLEIVLGSEHKIMLSFFSFSPLKKGIIDS
jgi:hypothetical protein